MPEPAECSATSLDGHAHTTEVAEYVGVCKRGHQRRGMVCSGCLGEHFGRPVAVMCEGCPADDRLPRVLIPADMWDGAIADA